MSKEEVKTNLRMKNWELRREGGKNRDGTDADG